MAHAVRNALEMDKYNTIKYKARNKPPVDIKPTGDTVSFKKQLRSVLFCGANLTFLLLAFRIRLLLSCSRLHWHSLYFYKWAAGQLANSAK